MIVNNACDYQKIRIALTEAGLTTGYLFVQKIQPPDNIQYNSFSQLTNQGDGGKARQGFANAVLTWVNPNPNTLFQIKKIVDNALNGTRLLYVTIPLNDGSTSGRTFIDISCIPHPISGQEAGGFVARGIAYSAITLNLNNVTIINNPAVF